MFKVNQNHDKSSFAYAMSKASSYKFLRKNDTHKSEHDFQFLSLREILQKSPDFLDHKIFQLDVSDCFSIESGTEPQFKYVQLKLSTIDVQKMMLQIIDVSHKILYNESKSKQVLLTMINAAVSHELRNPLSSLIGQKTNLDNCSE